MGQTEIPYCDATLDVSLGCRKRSPGCDHCWALPVVYRMTRNPSLDGLHKSLTTTHCGERMWGCGGVSYQWFPEALDKLLTKRPRFWFLNSKSDLFDERAGFADLAALFDRIAETPWHRYMILTKEVGRLSAFLGAYENEGRFNWPSNFGHVILMTSIEGAAQMTRWDHLAAIPAVHRGISFEPLLGPVAHELVKRLQESQTPAADIDWIVIGCEKLLGGRAGRWAGEEPDAWWGVTALIVNAAVKADVRVWMKQGPNLTHFAPPGPIKVTAALADFPPHCQIQQRPWGDWP